MISVCSCHVPAVNGRSMYPTVGAISLSRLYSVSVKPEYTPMMTSGWRARICS